jgi:GxxExxY protein
MDEDELSNRVIGLAIRVHRNLGPGLLKSAYEECLFYEVQRAGIPVEKQKPMPLIYEKVELDIGCRIDLMVDSKLIVEIKSVEALNDVHLAQILTRI